MKIIEKIADYIKSWIYYSTMKKWFNDMNMSKYNHWNNRKFARFRYTWLHCNVGKLKNQ